MRWQGFGLFTYLVLRSSLSPASAAADEPKTVLLRHELQGQVTLKVDSEYRPADPQTHLLQRTEDLDETSFYAKIAFVPGTNRVLTASWDGFLTLWEGDSGALVWKQKVASGRLSDFVLSADGKQAFVVGEEAVPLRVSMADGSVIKRYTGGGAVWQTTVALAGDGSLFAAGDIQGRVAVWSVDQEDPLVTFPAQDWPISAVAFAEDKHFVYSADATRIRLWDTDRQQLVRDLKVADSTAPAGFEGFWFSSLSFASAENYVVAGSYATADVVDLENGEVRRTFSGHKMGLISARLNEQTGEVVTVSRDLTLRFFDVETAELKRQLWLTAPLFSVMADAVVNEAGDRIAMATNDPSFSRMGSFPVLRVFSYTP